MDVTVVLFVDVVVLVNAAEAAYGATSPRFNALAAKLEAFVIRAPVAGEHVLPAEGSIASGVAARSRDVGGFVVLDPLAA